MKNEVIKRHFKQAATVLAVLVLISAVSCTTVTTAGAGSPAAQTSGSSPMYYGYGSGGSALEAMAAAKKAAVRQAAEDLLGKASTQGQKQDLDGFFDSVRDFNPYIYRDTQQTVNSSSEGTYSYTLGMRVNLDALASSLKAENILGGQIDGREGNAYSLADQPAPAGSSVKTETSAQAASVKSEKPSSNEPAAETVAENETAAVINATPEELAAVREYIDKLSYMVYFNEETASDPFLTRSAVVSANRYLDKQGLEYVDLAQIERIKEDQAMVYEEETGEAVSIIQWIAHKLNADIYVEISLDTSSRSEGGRFYGSASVSLNCYDASTAEGRGSAVYQTNPPAFSTVSEQDAVSNAVSSAVFKGMAAAVSEAEKETAEAVARGFKYNLTLINTFDSRMMRDFEKKLERRVKKVERLSYSPEESLFEVYLIGDINDLEDLVYDTAESIPGLEGIMLVMQRRNSITFDTGM